MGVRYESSFKDRASQRFQAFGTYIGDLVIFGIKPILILIVAFFHWRVCQAPKGLSPVFFSSTDWI